jgi:formylglycine-generating enzyme required for sulfatase activity
MLMGINPSYSAGLARPVERVSWSEATAYCDALTTIEASLGNVPIGYEYRLPTEAEWEYCCRSGSQDEFAIGNMTELFCSDARFVWSLHSGLFCNNPIGTANTGSFPPNAWSLFDMHGNVFEWCLDSYAPYGAGPVTDPLATGGTTRVVRGGSWDCYSDCCRSASRRGMQQDSRLIDIGFRIVLGPILTP